MHYTDLLTLGACAVVLSGCEESRAVVGPRTDYGPATQQLEQFIQHEMRDKEIPGLSIALVDGTDMVWARGFGFANPADSTPASAETVYRVGSLARLVTAIGVMQLVERGEVALDSPVARYLPEFKPRGNSAAITVRQLLSHRSGLPRESPVGSSFDSGRSSLADKFASLNQVSLVYSPGSRTKYSDAGMTVAGVLVERLRKQPFAASAQGSVLDPIGLRHSSFAPDSSLGRALARGFLSTYDGRTVNTPRFAVGSSPATGLYSTVTDLATLVTALMNGGEARGGRLLKPETTAEMWSAAADSTVGPGLGLGFQVYLREGGRRIRYGSAFAGYTTELTFMPEERLAVVMVATKEAANAVTARIGDAGLSLMQAARHQQALPQPATTNPLPPGLAKRLDGRYTGRGRQSTVDLEERNGRLILHRVDGDVWVELKALGDTLVVDDRLRFGERLLAHDDRIVLGNDTFRRATVEKPPAAPENLRGLVGEYGPDFNIVYAREEGGQIHLLVHSFFDYPLTHDSADWYRFPDRGLYDGEAVRFLRQPGGGGKASSIVLGGVALQRRSIAPEDGSTFKITPLRPTAELVKEALASTPPVEKGEFLKPDLVEVAKLDSTIHLDMRYATTNNFVSTAFYRQARAFAQRPAAEAMVRANRRLHQLGYGLLIHDSYRPWYVTKMFWDATPADKRVFVADPASGSRHNRGCAIDLTLYDRKTGKPIEMVSGYDEFSDRAYPNYPGGTSLQRWHRLLLRRAMEAEGFTVFDAEWWHFDYKDWRRYPILNVRFEDIGG